MNDPHEYDGYHYTGPTQREQLEYMRLQQRVTNLEEALQRLQKLLIDNGIYVPNKED